MVRYVFEAGVYVLRQSVSGVVGFEEYFFFFFFFVTLSLVRCVLGSSRARARSRGPDDLENRGAKMAVMTWARHAHGRWRPCCRTRAARPGPPPIVRCVDSFKGARVGRCVVVGMEMPT